jgi:diaminohydroxyphosphoribosylaminopyrimidine deaminase/5-amino-6-(5-phosphoribosylamino)uracil reductase
MVEGGAQTLQLFMDANLWDEARVFTSPRSFGEGIKAPLIKGRLLAQQNIESDRLEYFVPI